MPAAEPATWAGNAGRPCPRGSECVANPAIRHETMQNRGRLARSGLGAGSRERGELVAKLVWQVKLVAERHPGVTAETELACIERDADVGLAELGLGSVKNLGQVACRRWSDRPG